MDRGTECRPFRALKWARGFALVTSDSLFEALLKFAEGFQHDGHVHLVHFESFPDLAQQGDGQLAAEVFAEFVESLDHQQSAFGICVGHLAGEKCEPKRTQQAQDAIARFTGKESLAHGIDDIQRDADGDRFSMTDLVFGNLLQLVRGPMSEIQRPRAFGIFQTIKRPTRGPASYTALFSREGQPT